MKLYKRISNNIKIHRNQRMKWNRYIIKINRCMKAISKGCIQKYMKESSSLKLITISKMPLNN